MKVFGGTRLRGCRVARKRNDFRSVIMSWNTLLVALFQIFGLGGIFVSLRAEPVQAIAKESTLTMTIDTNELSVHVIPAIDGAVATSDDATISVSTDNYSGYVLSVATNNGTSLVDGDNNEIESISSIVSATDFATQATFKNKWGFKPSQYIQNVGGVNTVITNTSNYLPAPSSAGDLIDQTSAPNSTVNQYTISFAAKVDFALPNGTYSYTYIVRAISNPTIYNITYNANTNDTVTSMPTPNPQAIQIAGGTDTLHSTTTLSSAVPLRTGYTFAGWCDVATTFNSTTGNQECSGTTYTAGGTYGIDQTTDGSNITLYAIWNVNSYTIYFHPENGDSTIEWSKKYGDALGTLPAPIKADYILEGWYPNTNYTAAEKISDETLVTGDQHYYAHWVQTLFPIVWNQTGKCIFHGDGNGEGTGDEKYLITGSECADYHDKRFIDTGIALYSNDNYQKDYEVHFTIDTYNPNAQSDTQSTIFSDKLSTTTGGGSPRTAPYYGRAPGIIVRKNNSVGIEIKSTYGGNASTAGEDELRQVTKTPVATAYNGTDIRIFRIDGVIYSSVDNGPLIELQDVSSFNQQYGLSAWFGAYPDNVDCSENCTAAKRYFTGELSNMYIRLGEMTTSDVHDVTFNGNNGTPATTAYKVIDGDALTELPTVTRSGWLFNGWWTDRDNGQQISTATVPTTNTTYWAHWKLSVTNAQITNTAMQLSANDTETIAITNASDVEPYTLVSSDTSVATVDQSTGVVTAVGDGTATITMTGTISGDTRTISVTVGNLIDVVFDSQGGTPATQTLQVADGGSFSSLPTAIKSGSSLEGWYTGTNGTGTKLTTSTVFDTNTPTLYYANWEEATYLCKVATTLHTETCAQTGNSNGCLGAGYTTTGDTSIITYGTIPSSSTMTPGDAYDCDINNDKVWDATTERFYYFGTENGKAKFVYYKNMSDTSYNYDTALTYLPTSANPDWSNPNLTTFTGDYAGKVARFMTFPEAWELCDNTTNNIGVNGRCLYLLEKSAFANTTITDGIWLEKQTDYANRIQTRSLSITHGSTQANAPRPTIEVLLEYVEPYYYTITFNPHNETSSFTETVTAGEALGNKYPSTDPTYANHFFQGWYTAASGGTLVTDQTVPDSSLTYHAQWKGSVALAQVANSTISVVDGQTTTITVTNASDLEAFTFSSSDTSIATVDSSTGVVTAVAEGTATISIYGADSHATNSIVTVTVVNASQSFRVTFDPQNGDSSFWVDVLAGNAIGTDMPQNPDYTDHLFQRWYDISNNNTVTSATEPLSAMTVYAEWKLYVTQAVISNADLTLTAGDQLTLLVGNSSQLETYTFSSADTSIATVDSSTGVITGVGAGTVNIIMTGAQSNLTKTIEVQVTAAPVIKRTVTFNANGGSTPSPSATIQVDDGDPVGSLPTTSRANHMFFGWYTDDGTFYEEVTPETTVDDDVTYYARWIEDTTSFPIVWAEVNACTFNGTNHITGTYCLEDAVTGNALDLTKHYIDTAVKLFSSANYQKDFEIGFNIVSYNNTASPSQATFVTSKAENLSGWPGFTMRKNGTDTIQFTERFSMDSASVNAPNIPAATLKQVRIARINEKIYYAWNGASYTMFRDISANTTRFDTNVWFGATLDSTGNGSQRPIYATFTDMYIRLGQPTEYLIDFDPGNGSLATGEESKTIAIGAQVGQLPTPTPPSASYTFDAWYDESVSPAVAITSSTQPNGNKTYVAHYNYTSSDTPVVFDVSNDATRDYQDLIDGWVPSPVNITTFNEASPINNSTWGNTASLTELQFWNGIRSNFVDNGCLIPSSSDAVKPLSSLSNWTNGSVDCSKPDAYDTNIGAALNVYLNNAQGAQVTYTKADNGVIHNMIPGQTYYWEKQGDSTIYGYVTATSNGSSTGTRWVDTGTIRNVRDLGGLPVTYADGNNNTVTGTLAYGRLFRGEKLNSAPATELTNLGITTEYNVGDEYSSDTHLTDYHLNQVIHYNFDYNSGDENNASSNYMKAWTAVTNIMTDITNTSTTKNVFFHCRVGADRTGTVAYILEGLLGVPDEARYQEYELTNLSGLYDRTRYYKEKSSSNNLKFVYMMGYLKTTQDVYDWYMSNPNADASLIQSFRTAMTVPSS